MDGGTLLATCTVSQGMLKYAVEHIDDRGKAVPEAGKASIPRETCRARQVTPRERSEMRKAHAAPCTPAQGICHACKVPETRRLGSKQGQ